MIRDRALQARDKLVDKLPVTGELLRGSLLERVVRHKSGCPKCARGEGHQVYVLTANYQELKEAIEAICELNHDLLRPEGAVARGGRKRRD